MNLERLAELLPRYIAGRLPEEEMLAVSRALADTPGALNELRFALALRAAEQAEAETPPPFPRAVYETAGAPGLFPKPLSDGLGLLRDALGVMAAAVRMTFGFL